MASHYLTKGMKFCHKVSDLSFVAFSFVWFFIALRPGRPNLGLPGLAQI